MKKSTILAVFMILILLFTSCKTLKNNNCDCPRFGINPVKNSETNL